MIILKRYQFYQDREIINFFLVFEFLFTFLFFFFFFFPYRCREPNTFQKGSCKLRMHLLIWIICVHWISIQEPAMFAFQESSARLVNIVTILIFFFNKIINTMRWIQFPCPIRYEISSQ